MNRESSVEELAERTGEPVARLCECRSLGLIGSEDGEWFRPDDVERVRLIQLFLRRGIDLQTIAEAARGPVFSRLLSGYLDKFASGPAGATYSLADAADRLGLDVTVGRKFHEALGEPDDYLAVHAERRQPELEWQDDRERQRRPAEHAPPRGRGLADEPRVEGTAGEHDRRHEVEPADDGESRGHRPFTTNAKWPSLG